LNFDSLQDIQTLTLYEYQARMYAYRLNEVDRLHDMHLQAWLNNQVTATKEQGKKQVPVYRKFGEFFDYKKQLKSVEVGKSNELSDKYKRMAQVAKRVNEGR